MVSRRTKALRRAHRRQFQEPWVGRDELLEGNGPLVKISSTRDPYLRARLRIRLALTRKRRLGPMSGGNGAGDGLREERRSVKNSASHRGTVR